MDKLQQTLTKPKSKKAPTSKTNIIRGSIIATFIAITPYLFYLHDSVPDTKIWNTFLFTYDSNYFEDANMAMWYLTGKMLPFLLICLWFFTCRHWWYHALLVPMAMYVYQIGGFFADEYKYIDEFQLLHLVPVMALVIPSIYLIRARMFDKLNTIDKTMEDLEEEFKIKPKTFMQKLGDYF